MSEPRREQVDSHFIERVSLLQPPEPGRATELDGAAGAGLTGQRLIELFDAQAGSRHADFAARWLQRGGTGFYTISSAGHESNAALGAILRVGDPALPHYRSGGFYLARAAMAGRDGLRDVLLGVVASAEEPIAGGRHKVFGNAALSVIPQTSTIGSHPPRAVGIAFAIERTRKLGVAGAWPADAIVVCGFGDASVNHSTVQGALNAVAHGRYQGLRLPVLFVCEDNGIGISVPTPKGWVAETLRRRPGIEYFTCDGADIAQTYRVTAAAVRHVRERRTPALLHLRTVRFLGHAGSDVESGYRKPAEITAELAADPLLGTAKLLVEAGVLSQGQVLERYEAKRAEVMRIAADVCAAPRINSGAAVMAPLAPRRPDRIALAADRPAGDTRRAEVFDGRLPEAAGQLTVAQAINAALTDIMASRPQALVFGEDVARKGGVYGVTRGLLKRFGAGRVFDTLLDEQTILGLAAGTAVSGLLPIPEIQYLAYLHNAADQIRGEAATLRFFSQGQYRNPMVVRVAGYAYQKGFGGHFHNDNAIGALRDIPGVVLASPARPDDAAGMLRTCVAAAETDGAVCVFLEPIALYHTADLHTDGDAGWLAEYPVRATPFGRAGVYGDGSDLTMVTFGNGLRMSLRVANRLAARGIHARVVDLRWLSPLPVADLVSHAEATGRVLVVDETRRTGGVAEGVLAALVDAGFTGRAARVASEDSFVPLGPAANLVLLSEETIATAAVDLLDGRVGQRGGVAAG